MHLLSHAPSPRPCLGLMLPLSSYCLLYVDDRFKRIVFIAEVKIAFLCGVVKEF